MELRHVRYFIAVVEEGSMQAAARRLNLAQPALSRQIRDLEYELDGTLFERHARGVRLTRAGRAFHRDALAIMQAVEDATQRARKIGREQDQRVRLGLVRTAGKYAFTHDAIAGFSQKHPPTAIEFVRAASPDLADTLRSGRIELAILYQRQLDPRAFAQRIIHHERYLLAIHPRHRLAGKHGLHISDLAGEPLVWLSRHNNADHHDAIVQHFRVHGVEPVMGHEAGSHDEQIEIASVIGGICLTVASTQLTTTPSQLLFRPISDFELEVELRLAWRRGGGTPLSRDLRERFDAAIDAHQAAISAGAEPWMRTIEGQAVVRCP